VGRTRKPLWDGQDAAVDAALADVVGELRDRGGARRVGAAVAAGQQPVLAAVLEQVLAVGAAAAEAAFVAAGIEQGQHQVDEVAPVHGGEQGAAGLAAFARELEAVEEEGTGQAGREQDGCRGEDGGQGRRSWSMRRSSDSMVPFIAENSR